MPPDGNNATGRPVGRGIELWCRLQSVASQDVADPSDCRPCSQIGQHAGGGEFIVFPAVKHRCNFLIRPAPRSPRREAVLDTRSHAHVEANFMGGPIFINYRRSTTAAAAGRLYDRLEHHFAREDLFMDVDAIEPGLDFVEILDQQISNCRAFIAVIGPNWAGVTDEAGRRRLDNPNDYVRIELEAALKRNIRVIPVLVDGAQMPTALELPPPLRLLTRRQAIEVSHTRFASDVDLLVRAINRSGGTIPTRPNELQGVAPNFPLSLIQILFSFRGRIARAAYWKGMLYIAALSCF
jgi:hypothetical protein